MIVHHSKVESAPSFAYMEYLAQSLNTKLAENILLIPPDKGTGCVKSVFFENGFYLRYYNVHFNSDTRLEWCQQDGVENAGFKLFFTLGQSAAAVETDDPNSISDNATALYSSDTVRPYIINANTPVVRVCLLITEEWLNINFTDAYVKLKELIVSLTSRNVPAIISEKMGPEFYQIVKDLAEELKQDCFPMIHVKTKSMLLLNSFLDKKMYKEVVPDTSMASVYYDNMVAIEKRLNECILSSMPPIHELAQEYNMSSSTLQRHFKIVYGKNIYQYYLELKMNMGKEMIEKKRKSISEVAYLLGYNKINSFSRLFKKYFGILPKQIKSESKK